MAIDIKGIDKVLLLKALWSFQKESCFPRAFDEKEAATAVGAHIDYFCGRNIKMNLSKDSFVPSTCYEDDAGVKVADVVEKVRSGMKEFDTKPKPAPLGAVDNRMCAGCGKKFKEGDVVKNAKSGRPMCYQCHPLFGASF
jgi:hypothetical protein